MNLGSYRDGGIPKGCPQDLVTRLKRLEVQGRAPNIPPSPEELELDAKIRHWPRTAERDPYQAGVEQSAARWAILCHSLQRVLRTDTRGISRVVDQARGHVHYRHNDHVHTRRFTLGGSHSEIEIPEILDHLRLQHRTIELRYAWPFDLGHVANTLAAQIQRCSPVVCDANQ